jgi:hypothetical protein
MGIMKLVTGRGALALLHRKKEDAYDDISGAV